MPYKIVTTHVVEAVLYGRPEALVFSTHTIPPFSPVLIGGIGLRTLPLAALNPLLAKAMRVMVKRHRDVFERLTCLDHPVFAIDPIDLPFVFLLRPDLGNPTLIAVRSMDDTEVTASVHGAFAMLTQLLEGNVDGDALVFSRDLVIEGDTEAVLALRNAVDGGDIHIKEDLASIFGPLSGFVEKAAGGVVSLIDCASNDMEMLKKAATNHLNKRAEAHSAKIEDLEEQIGAIQKQVKKLKKRS